MRSGLQNGQGELVAGSIFSSMYIIIQWLVYVVRTQYTVFKFYAEFNAS